MFLDGVWPVRQQPQLAGDFDYVILGDNCASKEYGITDSQILGVLTSLRRNGKELDLNSFGYKLYVRARYAHFPVRVIIARLKRLARKILKR